LQLNWITLSLCLTELCVWYIFYDLSTVQLHRNCLTVRRTLYQCDKYSRLLTINDAAQFNVSFRSSMTHTNCWLYLMYYPTWHLSYQQTVNVQLSGTQISAYTHWGYVPVILSFGARSLLVFSFNFRPTYALQPPKSWPCGLHNLFVWFREEKTLLPLHGIEPMLLSLQPSAQSQHSIH